MDDISNDRGMEPADLPATEASVRDQAQSAIETDGLTQAAAAKEIGISGPILNQWLQGKYAGDNEKVDRKASQWLATRKQRSEAANVLPAVPGWFEGPSARAMRALLSLAHVTGDMVVLDGGAGVGKTTTCRHYRDHNTSVWLATMAPHCNTPVPALQEIGEAVGIKDMAHTGARPLHRAIVRAVSETGGLLIVDEAQHLAEKCLDQIRAIHDETGIGIALCGNVSIYTRLTGGNRAMHHAQLFSRIGARKHVERPAKGDVEALAEAWGIADTDIVAYLRALAAKPGALRGVTKTLRLAALQAGGVSAITLNHVQRAWANLGASR